MAAPRVLVVWSSAFAVTQPGIAGLDDVDPFFRAALAEHVHLVHCDDVLSDGDASGGTAAQTRDGGGVDGILSVCHGCVDGTLLDQVAALNAAAGKTSGVRVVSNYGVGVDHINLPDCASR